MPTAPSSHIRFTNSELQSKISSISNNEIEIHKPKFKVSSPPPRLHLLNKGENNFIPIDSKPHTTKGNLTDLYERLRKYYLRENKKSTSKKKYRFADDDSSMFDNVNVVIPGKYIRGECIKIFSYLFYCVRRVPPPVWRQQRDPVQEGQQHGGREVGHLLLTICGHLVLTI